MGARSGGGGGAGFGGGYNKTVTKAAEAVRKAWHSGDKAASQKAMAAFQKAFNKSYGTPKDSMGKTDYNAYTYHVQQANGIGLGYGD